MSDVSDVGLTSSWGEGGCIFIGAVTQVVIWVVVVVVDVLKKIPVGFGGAFGVFWYDGWNLNWVCYIVIWQWGRSVLRESEVFPIGLVGLFVFMCVFCSTSWAGGVMGSWGRGVSSRS